MKILTAAALLLLAAQAQALSAWRCGPDGHSYSDKPCLDGRTLTVDDARNPADVQAARRVAERDRLLAERLRQERLWRESQRPAPAQALSSSTPAALVPFRREVGWPTARRPKTHLQAAGANTSPAVAQASR